MIHGGWEQESTLSELLQGANRICITIFSAIVRVVKIRCGMLARETNEQYASISCRVLASGFFLQIKDRTKD